MVFMAEKKTHIVMDLIDGQTLADAAFTMSREHLDRVVLQLHRYISQLRTLGDSTFKKNYGTMAQRTLPQQSFP